MSDNEHSMATDPSSEIPHLTPAIRLALELHAGSDIPIPPASADMDEALRDLIISRRKEANKVRNSILNDDWATKVSAFRKLAQLDHYDRSPPSRLNESRSAAQYALIGRKFVEIAENTTTFQQHLIDCADLLYYTIGYLLEMGLNPLQLNMLMTEIHASALTRVDENGKITSESGKISRGESYIEPNLSALFPTLFGPRPTETLNAGPN